MKRNRIHWLATAHHADDQLETMIMRILRGSGIDGMSGIREKRANIIRPLLHFQKSELIEYVASHGLEPVNDPSNRDQSYDRVRVRNALGDLEGFDTRLASQSANALGAAREAIEWIVEQLASDHVQATDIGCTLSKTAFPGEIQRRLLLKCLHVCDPALSPRGSQIDQTIIALAQGRTVTLGDILCRGGESWTFQTAPKRRHDQIS
jgi:tRNA(Ile)-lysidine synthase